MSTFLYIYALGFGLCVGSFLNVLIARIPFGDSIVLPGSRCPNCFAPIHWYQNIPIVSWVALGARCRQCRIPISWRYPMVELVTGLAFLLLAILADDGWSFTLGAFFTSVLIALAMIDLDYYILPNELTYLLAIVGIAAQLFVGGVPWSALLLDVAGGPLILMFIRYAYWLVRRVEGIGLGDVKLMAGVGAFIGIEGVLFTLIAGSFLGAVVGLVLVAVQKKGMQTQLPFGPFLATAALIWMFWSMAGNPLLDLLLWVPQW